MKKVIFILGGPGVGKGTQCNLLAKENPKYLHLSAGDLLRAERSRPDSPYTPIINYNIQQGTIVPAQITIDLLIKAMKDHSDSPIEYFLIDGFPRNVSQGIAFEDQVQACSALLFFDCSENVLISRLHHRSKTSGRDDDNIEAIRKRLVTYTNETLPVIDHYTRQGKVYKIDCDASIEEISDRVKLILSQLPDK